MTKVFNLRTSGLPLHLITNRSLNTPKNQSVGR